MSTPDAARLGELARAAEDDGFWFQADYLAAIIDDDDAQCFTPSDAEFIAAASPSVILALLERAAELEAARSHLLEALETEWYNGNLDTKARDRLLALAGEAE